MKIVRVRSFSVPHFPAFWLENLQTRTLFTQSPWLVFCSRGESPLSSCRIFSSQGLLFSTSVCWLIHDRYIYLWLSFSFNLLPLVILSFSDKVGLTQDNPPGKVVLLKFYLRFNSFSFWRIIGFYFWVFCSFSKNLSDFAICFSWNLR